MARDGERGIPERRAPQARRDWPRPGGAERTASTPVASNSEEQQQIHTQQPQPPQKPPCKKIVRCPQGPQRPEAKTGEAVLGGGERMRRGDAKPRRAARTKSIASHPKARGLSPRALSAKRRTQPRGKRSFSAA